MQQVGVLILIIVLIIIILLLWAICTCCRNNKTENRNILPTHSENNYYLNRQNDFVSSNINSSNRFEFHSSSRQNDFVSPYRQYGSKTPFINLIKDNSLNYSNRSSRRNSAVFVEVISPFKSYGSITPIINGIRDKSLKFSLLEGQQKLDKGFGVKHILHGHGQDIVNYLDNHDQAYFGKSLFNFLNKNQIVKKYIDEKNGRNILFYDNKNKSNYLKVVLSKKTNSKKSLTIITAYPVQSTLQIRTNISTIRTETETEHKRTGNRTKTRQETDQNQKRKRTRTRNGTEINMKHKNSFRVSENN